MAWPLHRPSWRGLPPLRIALVGCVCVCVCRHASLLGRLGIVLVFMMVVYVPAVACYVVLWSAYVKAAEIRTVVLTSAREPLALDGRKVHIDSAVSRDPLRRAIAQHSMDVVDERPAAAILVVPSLKAPCQRAKLVASLYGLHITVPDVILAHGSGASLKHQRAIATRRFVWLSGPFQSRHDGIANIVFVAARSAGSMWVLMDSEAKFLKKTLQCTKGPSRTHRRFEAIALVSTAERVGVAHLINAC